MSLGYTFREGLSGFRRAKLSSTIATVTIAISLVLLGLFVLLARNAARVVDEIRGRIEFELFLQPDLAETAARALEPKLTSLTGVGAVTFVSKDSAAAIFQREYGEDVVSVAGFNPLPASYRIGLRPDYATSDSGVLLDSKLRRLPGVESVRYNKLFLAALDEKVSVLTYLSIGLGLIIAMSAIFLVSNTIRLTIYAKRFTIQTMKLVGATNGFIRQPFLIEGIVQGAVGGLLAAAFLYLAVAVLGPYYLGGARSLVRAEPAFYGLVVLVGMALGFVGSLISVRRFISTRITN